MGLIVSFTSYPLRINSVHMVVESLYKQTVQADEIILYLSIEEFPKAEDSIPNTLRELIGKKGFRIEWVEGNLKSHKKYYYALQKYREDIVITVDDDTIYAESMISDLVEGYQRFPYAIAARRTRIVLKSENGLESYRKWDGNLDEYIGIPRMDICAIGVGGVCYPPRIVSKRWFRKDTMLLKAEEQDDLWLKYNEIMDHIPTVYIQPSQKDIYFGDTKDKCLSISNVLYGGNDKCANVLLGMMKAEDQDCYEKWFHNLMNWEEYVEKKRQYYRGILKANLDKVQEMPIYLYGAGEYAKYLLNRLSILQLADAITSIVVTDKAGNPSELEGIMVRQLDEIDKEKRFGIIFGVSEQNRKQIETVLNGYDYCPLELNEWEIEKYFSSIDRWHQ